jgi:hypothetical protein
MDSGKLNEKITQAIETFNKYRSPESHAELNSMGQDSFSIVFSGHFCRSCGYMDYFDDFVIFLEESGISTEIIDVKEVDEASVVNFRIVGNS